MGRGLRLLIWTLAIAALAALVVFGLASNGSEDLGRSAPGLPTEHLAGPPVTLAAALSSAHGRATLVTFWASWCGPCAHEAGALESFSHSPSGRGRLIGVDWSDGLSGARSFVVQHHWTFPNLRDGEGLIGNDYHLTGLPTTFVIDSTGHIRAALRGPQSTGSLERAMASISKS
jgi:cytochrome c biogenesis protein CcmG, thiol:disulfide interchange protein DsbE